MAKGRSTQFCFLFLRSLLGREMATTEKFVSDAFSSSAVSPLTLDLSFLIVSVKNYSPFRKRIQCTFSIFWKNSLFTGLFYLWSRLCFKVCLMKTAKFWHFYEESVLSYPTTTTRHRRIPEECGSLLRQRPNTKSWSAIIQRTELNKRTSSSKQNFPVRNQNAHFSEPYNSETARQ